MEKVSVIVPVFNEERYLLRCLDCITAQTYRNLEILLIDDGSTDASSRICDDFAAAESRARVIHQENRGLFAARNRGIEESTGQYLIFPDADDYFHKDYIRLLYEAIISGGDKYQLAICDYKSTFDDNEDIVSESVPSVEEMTRADLLDKVSDFSCCHFVLWGSHWNKLYRRSALPIPFNRDYARGQDFDSNLRLFFQVDRAIYVRKVLYYWYQWQRQRTRCANYLELKLECRSRICYDNFISIPSQVSYFKPYLVANLYRSLLLWEDATIGTSAESAVIKTIKEFQRKTFCYFLLDAPLPFRRKVHWLLRLNSHLYFR